VYFLFLISPTAPASVPWRSECRTKTQYKDW